MYILNCRLRHACDVGLYGQRQLLSRLPRAAMRVWDGIRLDDYWEYLGLSGFFAFLFPAVLA
jgi:hypothetical protein